MLRLFCAVTKVTCPSTIMPINRLTLLLLASTAHALRLGIAPATVHRATSSPVMSAEPSFWDKLLYGQGGKPAPPPPPPGPPTLAALFAQLDRNKDGKLSSLEMERALRQIKVPEEEWDSIFTALHCEADATGCEVGEVEVTYNDFEARLPAATRKAIEAILTEEGKLPTLYVPPEGWKDTKTAEEIKWQEKVRMQAQKNGNQLRQNEILNREIGGL